jgi:uncharacterized protein (DUF58 family)
MGTSNKLIYSPSADIDNPPLFRSRLLRWIWRVYVQRLTRAGRWFFWPSGAIIAYAWASLELQGYLALSYVVGLWGAAWLAMLFFKPRVRLKVHHVDRVCAGETLPVEVEVEQLRHFCPDLYVVPHKLPRGIMSLPDEGVPVPALRKGEKARVRLKLQCWKRGVHKLQGYRVESDFPSMLLHGSRRFAEPRPLMVYPKFTRLARLTLPTGRRYHPGGVALASSLGESFEFIGNREYRDGDDVRDIDWRATARLNQPIVREYRDEYFLRVAVILDTHIPKGAKPSMRDSFESAVSVSAAISDYMARQEYLVDLFAAGPNLYHLTAGRSLAYLDQILDILACVEENPEEPFAIIEPEIMESLAKITTVICVFLDWNPSRRSFVQKLATQGAGVKVIIVREGKCTLSSLSESDLIGEIPVLGNADVQRGIEDL